MIRKPTPAEVRLFRKWAKQIGRFYGAPTSLLYADDMQELPVQSSGIRLVFSPARLRELLTSRREPNVSP